MFHKLANWIKREYLNGTWTLVNNRAKNHEKKNKKRMDTPMSDYNENGLKICSYFNMILEKLFINTKGLKFDGEKFDGGKIIDPLIDYENISKIELNSFRPSKKISSYHDTRPRKLDGTPDHRYKSSLTSSTSHTSASYILVYHTKKPNKKIFVNYTGSRDLSRSIIENYLKKYNRFFRTLENNIEFKNIYKDFLLIQKRCLLWKKDIIEKLKSQKQEKTYIFNRLYAFKKQFTEEQQKQFDNLNQDIKAIDSMIRQEIEKKDFKKDFDDIYKKLVAELEVEKNYQKKVEENLNRSRADDTINDLFKQLK